MSLPSFLQRFRAKPTDEWVASAATPSEEARTRARRRLIGAAVLVVVGVIGFPLLFDSQPRPLPSDLPIVMPHKDGGHDLEVPRVAGATAARRVDEPAPAARSVAEDETPAGAAPAAPAASAASPAVVAAHDVSRAATRPSVPAAVSPKPEAAAKPASKPDSKNPGGKSNDGADAARAQALLNGKEAAKPAAGAARAASSADVRYIVQIGAFADVPKAHEARVKVEKLGLKTYTQVVNGEGGKRIRVRLGPFPDKEAAEKAASKIRQAGMTAAILTL
ncbi:SPOR domain-containing protein [Aquabacterium sp.]|uniref:SPOR domain-containing protein n=1 Tax=Aquabacterium sp. TaxID=1872578 RepID=UPI0035B00BE7